MKKLFVTLFAIAMCVILIAGCDTKQDQQDPDNTTSTEAPATEEKTEGATETTNKTENKTENGTQSETETSKKDTVSAECVVKKGNRYVIVLPASGYSIPIGRDYVKYLSQVTDELVLAAEAKITEQVNALGETPNWTISSYGDDKMCLVVEVIVFAEGADYMEEGGCGIDHEHIFFAESIIEDQ